MFFGTYVHLLLLSTNIRLLGRGMESDSKYINFLGLGLTGILLNKRVIRNIAFQETHIKDFKNVYFSFNWYHNHVISFTEIIYKIWC